MSQGVTIKGKTSSGQSLEVQVDGQGRVVTATGGGGLAPAEFASWEITSASTTEDLITYYDANNNVLRTILVTFTSTAKTSIARAELQ